MPPDLAGGANTHRRFIRWRDVGIWEKLLDILIDDPDDEWLMIDASHCKVFPTPPEPKAVSGDGPYKRGLNTKIHLAVDAQGLPVRIVITEDSRADCTGRRLIESINADYLLADKGYDSDALIKQAKDRGRELVIPPRKTEPNKGLTMKSLYKLRHLVENAFCT